jgi:hypothetical protein
MNPKKVLSLRADRDKRRTLQAAAAILLTLSVLIVVGCETPSAHTVSRNYLLRPDLPIDPPGSENTMNQDCIEGGRLYKYYCGSCHNARPLSERPFSNYSIAVAHMRDQAYLTGQEYRQIIMFLRRWYELGPPTQEVKPSPKRMIFSQPIAELRKDSSGAALAPPAEGAGPFRKPDAELPAPPPLPGGGDPAAPPAAERNLPPPIN